MRLFPLLSALALAVVCTTAITAAPGDPRVVRVRAGSKIGMNDRDQIVRTGIHNPKGTRRILDAFQGMTVTPKDKLIGTRFTDKAIAIEAATEAVGKVYNVTVSMRVRHQELQVRNKREVWVTLETKNEDETFTLVVDFPRMPNVQLGVGQTYWIVAPKDVLWKDVKSKRPKLIEARSSERKVTLLGRKDGKTVVGMRYEIGPTQLESTVSVKTTKKGLRHSVGLKPNESKSIPLVDLESLTKLRNGRVLDLRLDPSQQHVDAKLVEGKLQLTGRTAGESTIDLIFVGMERRSKSPSHYVVTVDVAVAPGE